MQRGFSYIGSLLVGAALVLPLATTGCTTHCYSDPYYHDRHRWDEHERGYYNQWVIETRVEPHRDYRHLSREDQKRYWEWRHSHNHDRHRDHDHDRDRH
jgi:hypothetical protein